jgi:hypothetical protein
VIINIASIGRTPADILSCNDTERRGATWSEFQRAGLRTLLEHHYFGGAGWVVVVMGSPPLSGGRWRRY